MVTRSPSLNRRGDVGLALALFVGLGEGFEDVTADVHGEPVEVVAGVEEADVGGDQTAEAGQDAEGVRSGEGLRALADDGFGEVRVVSVVLGAVDVEDAPVLVEVHDDQFVGQLFESLDIAPSDLVVVLEDEPGEQAFPTEGDAAIEHVVASVQVQRGFGVPRRDWGAVGDRTHLGFQRRGGDLFGAAAERRVESGDCLCDLRGAVGDVAQKQVPVGILPE